MTEIVRSLASRDALLTSSRLLSISLTAFFLPSGIMSEGFLLSICRSSYRSKTRWQMIDEPDLELEDSEAMHVNDVVHACSRESFPRYLELFVKHLSTARCHHIQCFGEIADRPLYIVDSKTRKGACIPVTRRHSLSC